MTLDVPLQYLFLFLFVTARVAGLVMVAPGFGSGTVPMRIRGLLVLALSLLIAPLQPLAESINPNNLGQLVWLTGNELGVGIVLGVGMNMVFASAQLAGQIIGQMSGMQASDIFNPTLGASIPLFAQLLDLMMVTIFITIGGHQMVLGALMQTFQEMPVTQIQWESGSMLVIVDILSSAFVLGIKIAAPVTVTMLVSLVVLGLVGRALPQMNLQQIGFSLNALLALFVIAVTMGAGLVWFEEELFNTLDLLRSELLSKVATV